MPYSTMQNYTTHPVSHPHTQIAAQFQYYPVRKKKRELETGLRRQGSYKKSLPHKPLLSIITVCYNSVKTIEPCILSVLEQDYDNVEYIIIDGGSTDGTLDILKQYEHAIDYIISEQDEGFCDAMNKGIALASGDVINMLNSDDRFMPNVLKEYAQAFNNRQAKIVYAFAHIVDEYGEIQSTSHTTFDSVFFDCVAHQTVFITRNIVEKIGYFDATYPIAFDAKFLMDSYLQCTKEEIILFDKATVLYFNGGISKKQFEQYNEEFINAAYDVYGSRLGLSKDIIAFIHDNRNMIELSEDLKQKYKADTVLKAFLNLKVSAKNADLLHTLLSQYINYSNLDRGYTFLQSELIHVQNNWWYKFGQLSKREKILVLLRKLLNKNRR